VAHIDSHCYLVLHHLHELAEGSIFLGVYHVVLRLVLTVRIVCVVIDHICNETDLKQIRVLGQGAELEAELLMCRVVEI